MTTETQEKNGELTVTREQIQEAKSKRRQACFEEIKQVLAKHDCALRPRALLNEQGQIVADLDIIPMD